MATTMQTAAEKFLDTQPSRTSLDQYIERLQQARRLTPIVLDLAERADRVRAENDLVFYIAGGLTGVSEEIKSRYEATSKLISSYDKSPNIMFGYAPHMHGTDPVKHSDVTPQEVRDIDYMFARVVPDGHMNFLSPMAHGNAIEEGWAEEAGIPALYVVSRGVHLSRLVRGMDNVVGTVEFEEFAEDGLSQIGEYLDALQAGRVA